mmetsp:Transcript_82526/g.238452  ORF Transcript_82526/g.238452 Transcript_82526/m.238452 type:complete len:886 (-) Transcript_82526:40-2697(-)
MAAAPKDKSYRVLLPSDVIPEKYDLTLEPDLMCFKFDGVVKIECDVQVATDRVIVHGKELIVSSAKFTPAGGSDMKASEITVKVKSMTITMGFDEVLPVGKGVLEIAFRGELNDQMAGFYRSQYTDSKGQKRHMATTQFEAIDARRCFPCWDEPGRKAVFVVTLVYPADLMALSNMPQSRSEIRTDGKRVETFMPTPLMSTYLLAFCIGEFEFISGQTTNGTLARIFCCPGNVPRCSYALKCCLKALEFYDDFFGIPYPLPKMDMIAIPDFAAGAMENWGLVTYREVALLCDEKTVSATQKQRICSVITHELAHQWFGNLVTMQWWDDLWLNEGFANWMQTFAADKLHPEWHIWESYVGMEQQRALQLDALRSSHPIQVPIGAAETVEEVFDAISYCKGGSVVRMIYAVLGEAHFQQGLRIYFGRHKYGNTETTDLWQAWAEASGKPVAEMMSSWTQQMGFPVLKVLKDPLAAGATEIEVEQSWFLADGAALSGEDAAKAWVAPVLVGTDAGSAPAAFLERTTKAQKVAIGGGAAGAKSWLKVNFGQHVPMRVLYPKETLERLAKNLKSLPAEDRIGLLSDAYALCKAGLLPPPQLVQLLSSYAGEDNDKVWSELSAVLGGLDRVVRQGLGDETAEAFVDFAARLVGPAFGKVGWDEQPGDSDNQRKLRSTLVQLLGKYCYKDAAVVAEAKERFKKFIADPNDAGALSADIRPAVLSMVVKGEGSSAVFDQLMAAHDAVTDGAVRIHIYGAIGDCPASLQRRALEWVLSDAVRSQDLFYIPMSMTSGREGAEAVFDWVNREYDRIYGRIGTTSMILFQHIVRISGAGFVSAEKAAAVEAFWKAKPVHKMVEKTLEQTVEGIRTNAKFVDHLKPSDVAKPAAWSKL